MNENSGRISLVLVTEQTPSEGIFTLAGWLIAFKILTYCGNASTILDIKKTASLETRSFSKIFQYTLILSTESL